MSSSGSSLGASSAAGGSTASFRRARETATFYLEKEKGGFGMIIDPECKVAEFKGEATKAESVGIQLDSHIRKINGARVAVKGDIVEALKAVQLGEQVAFEMDLPYRELRRQDSTGVAIELRGSRERTDDEGKAYTTYTIHVDAGKGVQWDTEKRFSEFRALKNQLIAKHPGCQKLLPEFPHAVTGLGVMGLASKKHRTSEITARRVALEDFIAAAAKNGTVGMDQLFLDFLDAPQSAMASEAVAHLWHASSRTSLLVERKKRVTRAGMLEKKGTGKGFGGRRNWTARWLVLTDFKIEWHDSEEDCERGDEAKRSIPLEGATVKPVDDDKYFFAFSIAFPPACDTSELRLQVPKPKGDLTTDVMKEAESDRQSWMTTIQRVIDRSNRVGQHRTDGRMAGPGTAVWYAEELETVPESNINDQEVLLAELIRAVTPEGPESSNAEFVKLFVSYGGVQHLFAMASKWTQFWRVRLDRALLSVVGYVIQQECGKKAILYTPGVMHALIINLKAPTDEVQIETLSALSALSMVDQPAVIDALGAFAMVCGDHTLWVDGEWQGPTGDKLGLDTLLGIVIGAENSQLIVASLALVDALVTGPASTIQRGWMLNILHDADFMETIEDLRTEYRDDEMVQLQCSRLKQAAETTKKEMAVLRASHGFEIATPRDAYRALTTGAIKENPEHVEMLKTALKTVLSTLGGAGAGARSTDVSSVTPQTYLQRWIFLGAALVSACLNADSEPAAVIDSLVDSMRGLLGALLCQQEKGGEDELPVASMLYDAFAEWMASSGPGAGDDTLQRCRSTVVLKQIEQRDFNSVFLQDGATGHQ
eukprot:COSAG02_NODE_64_length_43111_cov_35.627709_16_plen_823_part_00